MNLRQRFHPDYSVEVTGLTYLFAVDRLHYGGQKRGFLFILYHLNDVCVFTVMVGDDCVMIPNAPPLLPRAGSWVFSGQSRLRYDDGRHDCHWHPVSIIHFLTRFRMECERRDTRRCEYPDIRAYDGIVKTTIILCSGMAPSIF